MAAKKKAKKKKATRKKATKKATKKKRGKSSRAATGGRKPGKGDRRTLGDYLYERLRKNAAAVQPSPSKASSPPKRRSRRGR